MGIRSIVIVAALCATASAEPQHAAPTKAQLASGRKHMKAGWAAQRAKKWAEATKEFEAALVALDGDARALSELGWSAMNAGDYAKARRADEAAVAAATDPKVKAASLYNLGLVQVRLDDKAGALRSFTTSLALRPNKTVNDEIIKLGAKPEDPPPPFCPAPKKTCECLTESLGEEATDCAESTTIKSPVAGWKVWDVQGSREAASFLLDQNREVVAQVGGAVDMMRRTAVTKLESATVKKVGGHSVLWLEITDNDNQDYMTETNFDSSATSTKTATVCAIGDAKVATRCFTAPRSIQRVEDHSLIKDDGSVTSAGSSSSDAALELTLADDGTLTVKLAKGSVSSYPPSLLGPHKLW